jgi:hypothetical protein
VTAGGATVVWVGSGELSFPVGTAEGATSVRGCCCSDAYEREGGCCFEGLEVLRVNQDNIFFLYELRLVRCFNESLSKYSSFWRREISLV